MNNPKLLPCPFCGHKAMRRTMKWSHAPKLVRVFCPKCDTGTNWMREDYRDAVAVWNSRAADTVAKLAEPYNFSLLCDWYIHSVTGKPVWTEAHIKELLHDFYLIPKGDLP